MPTPLPEPEPEPCPNRTSRPTANSNPNPTLTPPPPPLPQSHFELATEMEIAKALYYMRSRQFEQAIETLKSYENKEHQLVAYAATNLALTLLWP